MIARVTKNKSGFTLVEVLIMISILGLFFSAIFPLVLRNALNNYAANLQTRAYQAAQGKVEQLRNTDYDTISNSTFTVSTVPSGNGTVTVSQDINGDGLNEVDIKKVSVTVSYSLRGQTKNVIMATFINKRGISSVSAN